VPDTVFWTSLTGIVVSGVVGPSATSWGARRTARKEFVRDQGAARRDELRTLLDEAAQVLGVGPIRLRQIWDEEKDEEVRKLTRAWPDEVYVIGQRLQLRLGVDSSVVAAYERLRRELRDFGEIPPGETDRHAAALKRFREDRSAFLTAALAKLDEPISDKEPK
jgi:hypothetical protein